MEGDWCPDDSSEVNEPCLCNNATGGWFILKAKLLLTVQETEISKIPSCYILASLGALCVHVCDDICVCIGVYTRACVHVCGGDVCICIGVWKRYVPGVSPQEL